MLPGHQKVMPSTCHASHPLHTLTVCAIQRINTDLLFVTQMHALHRT